MHAKAMNVNPEDMKDWIRLAKYHKMLWIESTEKGDLTPTVFAERKGEFVCAVVSASVDKVLGLKAAAILRKGAEADAITIILDAHMKHESSKEAVKNYEPGEMQRMCDNENACERGIIADCLICHRIDLQKKIKMASIPYYYHGKGSEFKWLNDPENFHEYVIEDDNVQGNVPNSLRNIMDIETFSGDPMINLLARKMIKMEQGEAPHQRQLYHTTRAVYQALSDEGYKVFDYMGHNLPYEEFAANLQK